MVVYTGRLKGLRACGTFPGAVNDLLRNLRSNEQPLNGQLWTDSIVPAVQEFEISFFIQSRTSNISNMYKDMLVKV
jgi:hypothetical protein